MADALFHRDGDLVVPTRLARGPWQDDAQHGGPPAALLAHTIEQLPDETSKVTVRLTVELMRPVPLSPLRVSSRVIRPGRRVRLVEASIHDGETEVARATALQIAVGDHPLPAHPHPPGQPARPEDGVDLRPPVPHRDGFHASGVDISFTRGAFTQPGPGFAWIRLRVPVVDDDQPSPLQRVAAAADFGNGVGSFFSPREWYFINPDLTVYLDRYPVGEWVGLESDTRAHGSGVGVAESLLWDADGPVGRSLQALVIWPRDPGGASP